MAEVAVAVAVSVAVSALTYALTPKPQPERQSDISILKSEYGTPIPKVYGKQKVLGNVIWGTELDEKKQGGKGAPAEYVYSGTFAVALCEGEIQAINKIWLNNRLVYFVDSDDPNATASSTEFANEYCTFYYGTNNQDVDPTIEAIEGVGNAPAFNNLVYIVFNNLPLKKYGNILPTVQVEIVQSESITLQEIVEDVCARRGLSIDEYDASLLSDQMVYGAIYEQDNQSPRDFIESLQKAYQFLVRDVGNKLEFIPITQDSYIDVPFTDLSTREYGADLPEAYNEIREQTLDLPSVLQLEYPNVYNSYKRSIQTIYKSIATHFNEVNERTTVVLDDSQALTSVKKGLEYYWLQRVRYEKISLPAKYLGLKPGDLIALNIRNQTKLLQISKLNRGANLVIDIEASAYDGDISEITLTSPTNTDYTTEFPLVYAGQPTAIILDTNLLSDTDSESGVYGSVQADPTSAGWGGGAIAYSPVGGQYSLAATVIDECALGVLLTELPASDPFVVDTTSRVQVQISQQLIENIPDFDFYNLSQIAYINGELICFQNATLVSANTYELSNLIRGVRGTESFITSHPTDSDFYLVKGDFGFINIIGEFSQLNQEFKFKAVPDEVAISSIIPETPLTVAGNRLKPYSPINPVLIKKSNNDLLLEWTRRSRRNGGWVEGIETVPLNEESEKYDIEFYNGSTLVLTVTDHTNPYYLLTSSQQNTLFGSTVNSLTFKVFQKSVYVGRGYPLEETNFAFTIIED